MITEPVRRLSQAPPVLSDAVMLLAHELRNPLAPIANAAHVLSLQEDPALKHLSEVLTRQIGHMRRLIDDMLDLSRVERGVLELRRELVDMRDVLSAATEQVMTPIRAHRHELTVRASDEPAPVLGDGARLVQVVANLLHNAAKYTPDGGSIVLQVAIRGPWIDVEVADNGQGLAPEFLPFVFDPFRQARPLSPHSENGLGIGLALVRSFVELHGGQVAAASPGPGCGSTFTVKLPAAGMQSA